MSSSVSSVSTNSGLIYGSGTKAESGSDLSVNNFLELIAAQLQNQDMFNPVKDTDFMAQLAQFTTLQVMQNVQELNMAAYSASLVGKEVVVADYDKSGNIVKKSGEVTGVGFYSGSAVIFMGDEQYDLNQIMVVGKIPETTEPEDPTDPKDTDKTDPTTGS